VDIEWQHNRNRVRRRDPRQELSFLVNKDKKTETLIMKKPFKKPFITVKRYIKNSLAKILDIYNGTMYFK
jgi:hypothetical protein